MTNTELIREEIERRLALYKGLSEYTVNPNRIDELEQLLDFINSLPKEYEMATDCKELEEEVKKYINDNWQCEHSNENAPLYLYDFSNKDLLDAARHFAKWGAEHLKK